MPVYDYNCLKCGKTQTQTVSIKAEAVKIVCECGEAMQRIYGLAGITFNGTGWASKER